MNYDDFHSSRSSAFSYFGGSSHIVQIARIEREQLPDGKVKPAIYFVGKQKALLVNKTNWGTFGRCVRQGSEEWSGRSIGAVCDALSGAKRHD